MEYVALLVSDTPQGFLVPWATRKTPMKPRLWIAGAGATVCADCGAPIVAAKTYCSHIGTPRERAHCEECSRFKANAQAFVHVVQRRFAFEWGRSL